MSESRSRPLPYRMMSPPGSPFSRATSSAASPRRMTVFCHDADFIVFDATYFRIELIRSAKPSSFGAVGQNAANTSYVTRPRRMASISRSSSFLKRCWSCPVYFRAHALLPSGCGSFPGASITPSRVTNSDAISLRTPPPHAGRHCSRAGRNVSSRAVV